VHLPIASRVDSKLVFRSYRTLFFISEKLFKFDNNRTKKNFKKIELRIFRHTVRLSVISSYRYCVTVTTEKDRVRTSHTDGRETNFEIILYDYL